MSAETAFTYISVGALVFFVIVLVAVALAVEDKNSKQRKLAKYMIHTRFDYDIRQLFSALASGRAYTSDLKRLCETVCYITALGGQPLDLDVVVNLARRNREFVGKTLPKFSLEYVDRDEVELKLGKLTFTLDLSSPGYVTIDGVAIELKDTRNFPDWR